MRFVTSTLTSLLLASTFVACATDAGEDIELPDTITDGAADSWAHPTRFGQLFEAIWQRGEIDPSRNQSFPAWDFSLTGDAEVSLTTRQAPTDEPDLTRAVVYLYKQRDNYTWQRIAQTSPANGWGALTKQLAEGEYRVIVKGVGAADAGELLLRRDCTGAGCESGPQCLVGDAFNEVAGVQNGALVDYGSKELSIASELSTALEAQIIAAVRESAHDDVTTIERAFAAVDGEVVNRYRLWDNLAGRSLVAIEYGAGDNSYGAFFVEDEATVAAAIHDGDIDSCSLVPKACVFGEHMGEAEFMPSMTKTSSKDFESPAGVDAATEKQILAAVGASTLAEAFDGVDEGTFYVETYRHDDGRAFTEIHWYGGDNPVGTFFAGSTTDVVAGNGDGDLYGCTAY